MMQRKLAQPGKLNATNEPGNWSVRLIANVRLICYSHSDFSGAARDIFVYARYNAETLEHVDRSPDVLDKNVTVETRLM